MLFWLLLTACDEMLHCTNLDAPGSLTVEASPALGSDADLYFMADRQTIRCTVHADVTQARCDVPDASFSRNDDGTLVFMLSDFVPDSFTLMVIMDGEEQLNEDIWPDYDEVERNGEGCGATRQGTVSVTLPVSD